MVVYCALLRRMSPDQKFNTVAKLCRDVLAGVADGSLSVDEPECEEVLRDALAVLACPEIRVREGGVAEGREKIAGLHWKVQLCRLAALG
jgi:hypothetical protein